MRSPDRRGAHRGRGACCMRSELPAPENEDRRIIPFPRLLLEEPSGPRAADGRAERAPRTGEQAGIGPLRSELAARHYLKFMLPSIPITMFVVGFIYCSLLMDPRTPVSSTSPAARGTGQSPLPLVGALLFAITSGLLCVMIYYGYLRASGERVARGE